MHYFFPAARNEAEAVSLYRSIRNLVEDISGESPKPSPVESVEFYEAGFKNLAAVGCYLENDQVACILETTNHYWVLSAMRGLRRGDPVRIPKPDVIRVARFSELQAASV